MRVDPSVGGNGTTHRISQGEMETLGAIGGDAQRHHVEGQPLQQVEQDGTEATA